MTEFYLLGCVIVFTYTFIKIYKEMPKDGFNIVESAYWVILLVILTLLSWVSILSWVYDKIRKEFYK